MKYVAVHEITFISIAATLMHIQDRQGRAGADLPGIVKLIPPTGDGSADGLGCANQLRPGLCGGGMSERKTTSRAASASMVSSSDISESFAAALSEMTSSYYR
jgi:hypothetical protein